MTNSTGTLVGSGLSGVTRTPFRIREGSQNLDMSEHVESGDCNAPENKNTDRLYEGKILGEGIRAPFSGHDSMYYDSTSEMYVGGRVKHNGSKSREFDFTVTDSDKNPNLQVRFEKDFEGDGRLVITNPGLMGGTGEIEFPMGTMSKAPDCYMASESSVSKVQVTRTKEFGKVVLEETSGQKRIFEVKNGALYEEAAS
jgi:hypothetical protein